MSTKADPALPEDVFAVLETKFQSGAAHAAFLLLLSSLLLLAFRFRPVLLVLFPLSVASAERAAEGGIYVVGDCLLFVIVVLLELLSVPTTILLRTAVVDLLWLFLIVGCFFLLLILS